LDFGSFIFLNRKPQQHSKPGMATHLRLSLAYRDLQDVPATALPKNARTRLKELDLSNNFLTFTLPLLSSFPPPHPTPPLALCAVWVSHHTLGGIRGGDIREVGFLRGLEALETLVLDGNKLTHQARFPPLEHLHTLWVNRNAIGLLPTFIDRLTEAVPRLRFLSMLGNPACPNYLNGGTLKQYKDYRWDPPLLSSGPGGTTP